MALRRQPASVTPPVRFQHRYISPPPAGGGGVQRTLTVNRSPFTVGRKADRDLVIADARVSREHAEIVSEEGKFFVVDIGSRHGTYVNGHRVQRHKLQGNDRMEFGVRENVYAVFQPGSSGISPAGSFSISFLACTSPTSTTWRS